MLEEDAVTVYETFCGIGGFSLGFKRAGFEIIGGCEIDPYARAVYEKNFGVKTDGDIRAIESIPADIICGGFPCQNISLAGKREGITGEQSSLWFELLRIIKKSKPKFIVIENVPSIRSNGLLEVLKGINEVGYDAEWDNFSAQEIGANHKRERFFLVGYPKNESRLQTDTVFSSIGGEWDAWKNSCSKHWRETPESDWFVPESISVGVDDGLPNRMDRVRCLGNAIVPQISEWIAKRIKEMEML